MYFLRVLEAKNLKSSYQKHSFSLKTLERHPIFFPLVSGVCWQPLASLQSLPLVTTHYFLLHVYVSKCPSSHKHIRHVG